MVAYSLDLISCRQIHLGCVVHEHVKNFTYDCGYSCMSVLIPRVFVHGSKLFEL